MNDKKQLSVWQRFIKSMTKANELGKEEDVMTDHDYDGIRELDNVLPPWWLYGFYITIAIAIFYIFQVFYNPDNYNQKLEYADEVEKGKELFASKTCTACHLADLGGSIGPNLTDDKWILGGGFKNIYNTISKGGRPGKGMIAWESTINQKERQQLTSYIMSIQGTTPANPKAEEGDITWSKQ